MRNGDAYKIGRLIEKDGCSDEEILERFKWDYPEEEIQTWIDHYRAPKAKPKAKSRARSATTEE